MKRANKSYKLCPRHSSPPKWLQFLIIPPLWLCVKGQDVIEIMCNKIEQWYAKRCENCTNERPLD
jgi:hypothetical protein